MLLDHLPSGMGKDCVGYAGATLNRWAFGTVLLLPACIDFNLDPVDAEAPPAFVLVTDRFVQEPLPAVDVLVVVDDTASMAREQTVLAEQLPGLGDALLDAGVQWQLGVVTTDMAAADAGWLRGQPWVLTPSTDDLDAALAGAVQVGTTGAGPEAGLAAAVLALDLSASGEVNEGFRRNGAALHVVFVSDADDASDPWLGPDPVGVFLGALDAQDVASAVVGDLPSGCNGSLGTAGPAPRYHSVANATGGATVSICDIDLLPVVEALGEASLVYTDTFELRGAPVPGTVRVEVDGVRVDGWTVLSGPPRVTFDVAPPPESRIDVGYALVVSP